MFLYLFSNEIILDFLIFEANSSNVTINGFIIEFNGRIKQTIRLYESFFILILIIKERTPSDVSFKKKKY